MLIDEVGDALLAELDKAAKGSLTQFQNHCRHHNLEGHITMDVHDKEMTLFVLAFKKDQTVLFRQTPLQGTARALGWNLFLAERADATRREVGNNDPLGKVDLTIKDDGEEVMGLFTGKKVRMGSQAN